MPQFYHPDLPPQQILARCNPLKNKALRFPVRIMQKKLAVRGGFCIFLTSADALQYQPTKPMSKTQQRKQALRHDIMNVIKANGIEVTGDFWFMLIFRTESELKNIAKDLHIKAA